MPLSSPLPPLLYDLVHVSLTTCSIGRESMRSLSQTHLWMVSPTSFYSSHLTRHVRCVHAKRIYCMCSCPLHPTNIKTWTPYNCVADTSPTTMSKLSWTLKPIPTSKSYQLNSTLRGFLKWNERDVDYHNYTNLDSLKLTPMSKPYGLDSTLRGFLKWNEREVEYHN